MTQDAGDQAKDFCWGALAVGLLHPVQVEIIEALRWIDRSLSTADLLHIFEGRRMGLRIERHMRRLAKLDAVELEDIGHPRPAAEFSYRLVRCPRPRHGR